MEDKIRDSNEDNIDISSIINLFIRRKTLFFISFSLFLAFFFVQTLYERKYKPLFRGDFKILINDPINNGGSISNIGSASDGMSPLSVGGGNNVTFSVIELLLSDESLNPIAKKFGISNKNLRNSIKINPGGFNNSDSALTIILTERKIDRGIEKLDLLSKRFSQISLEQKQKKITSGLDYLNKLLPELELKVLSIQDELVEFREANNIITPIDESEALKSKLIDIEQKIAIAENKFQPESNIMKNLIEERNIFLKNFRNQPELIKIYENYEKKLQLAEDIYSTYVRTKQQLELDFARENTPFRVISAPYMNPNVVYPSVSGNLRKGALISLFLGIVIIFIKDRSDKVFHSRKDIEKDFNLPILGEIPYANKFSKLKSSEGFIYDSKEKENLSVKDKTDLKFSDFLFKEAIRKLFLSFSLSNVSEELKVITITSSISSEGKSLLNAMLAINASQLGKKVLIIDSDLRKPTLDKILNLENIVGLSNILTNKNLAWKDILQEVKSENNLFSITSGPIPPDPILLLSSQGMTDLINSIKDSNVFDLIVIDLPPVLGLADASYAFKNVDAVSLIVTLENVPTALPKDSLKIIQSNQQTTFVGLIINQVNKKVKQIKPKNDYYYNSYYKKTSEDIDINEGNKSFIKKFLKKFIKIIGK